MIPISLVVTLELIKAWQLRTMVWNNDLKTNGKAARINSVSVNEELGQIQYILSDKTGT